MKETLRVAAAQINPRLGDIGANVAEHLSIIKRARAEKVDVLVFPELSLTGYRLGGALSDCCLRTESAELAQLAAASGSMTTVIGFVELGFAAQLHNSTIAVKDGKALFLHRKINLATYGQLEEGKHFAPGRYLETFPLNPPWQASSLICADLWNPGLVHLCAVKGATLLLASVNSAEHTVSSEFSNPEAWDALLRFYARIYGLPVVMCNRWGKEEEFAFWGGSVILDERGQPLAQAGGSENALLISEINYKAVLRARSELPTVRDSNLDLIHREIGRVRDTIGYPALVRDQEPKPLDASSEED